MAGATWMLSRVTKKLYDKHEKILCRDGESEAKAAMRERG